MHSPINKYSKSYIFNVFFAMCIFMCSHFGVTLRKFTKAGFKDRK